MIDTPRFLDSYEEDERDEDDPEALFDDLAKMYNSEELDKLKELDENSGILGNDPDLE